MNLRSYDKNTRMLKIASFEASGISLQGENNVLVIGVINCTESAKKLAENISFAIRKENGIPLKFKIENFDYVKSITPATAKYGTDYIEFVSKSAEAIIRTNMLDCVVAIVDNNIMGMGILQGCTKTNCPIILMPTGLNENYNEDLFLVSGKVATREIKSTEVENISKTFTRNYGISPVNSMATSFFNLAEKFGLMLPNADKLKFNTTETLDYALKTGSEALKRADDIITTKRLISKKTLNEALDKSKENGATACGILQYKKLFDLVDVKMPNGLFNSLKGSLANEAYVVSNDTAPLTMQNQVWAYDSIADTVTALVSNAIDNGIIVLKNCLGCDVSIVAKTIIAMKKQNEIALMTDGNCCSTDVLTIACVTPSGFENEDFANIQTGDILEIDVAKGRLNTNVTSKDMKLRAKRNIVKKHETYF